jgi:hypothetical protein
MSDPSSFADGGRAVSYEGRRFCLTLVGGAPAPCTVTLDCRQQGDLVVGFYTGDEVDQGALLAIVRAMGCLEGRFHHMATGDRLESGRCWATPQHTARGQIRLYFEWQMGEREGVLVLEES